MKQSRGWRTLAVATTVLIVALGACGDDDDETTTDATTTTAGDTETVDVAAFCDAAIEADRLFMEGPESDPETGEPTEDGITAFVASVTPHIQAMTENAPEEISDDVAVVIDAGRKALQGDQSAIESDEFSESDEAIDGYLFDNCEFDETAEIAAVDYGYDDVPEELSAGRFGLRMSNEGEEIHEAVVLRISDETDMTIEEILELPEEEAMELAEFRGVAFAPPGESSSTVLELDAGSYALVCFLPVGATSFDALESGELEGADTHWARGMLAELTVS